MQAKRLRCAAVIEQFCYQLTYRTLDLANKTLIVVISNNMVCRGGEYTTKQFHLGKRKKLNFDRFCWLLQSRIRSICTEAADSADCRQQ